jgi:hypothetical protein
LTYTVGLYYHCQISTRSTCCLRHCSPVRWSICRGHHRRYSYILSSTHFPYMSATHPRTIYRRKNKRAFSTAQRIPHAVLQAFPMYKTACQQSPLCVALGCNSFSFAVPFPVRIFLKPCVQPWRRVNDASTYPCRGVGVYFRRDFSRQATYMRMLFCTTQAN